MLLICIDVDGKTTSVSALRKHVYGLRCSFHWIKQEVHFVNYGSWIINILGVCSSKHKDGDNAKAQLQVECGWWHKCLYPRISSTGSGSCAVVSCLLNRCEPQKLFSTFFVSSNHTVSAPSGSEKHSGCILFNVLQEETALALGQTGNLSMCTPPRSLWQLGSRDPGLDKQKEMDAVSGSIM